MSLTLAEAEAAARALRRWPAGQRAYALAWMPEGPGYHQASFLARALRDGACSLSQLGPAATIAVMRLSGQFTGQQLGDALVDVFLDLRLALDLSIRDWIDALGDPPVLAARLEDWAIVTRAYLRGERLDPAGVEPPSPPDAPNVVPLSTTARQALRVLAADPDARLLYDQVLKGWFVRSPVTTVNFRVREPTGRWLLGEALVELEALAPGEAREDRSLRYVASAHGRRCLAAEERARRWREGG